MHHVPTDHPFFYYIHPMNKIEHIGIAVRNLEEAIKTYTELLGTECYKTEAVESEGVKTAFFQVGDSKIELLEASNEASPIAKFIEKKGEGIHHIAFDVTDIKQSMDELASKGFQLLNEQPKNGPITNWSHSFIRNLRMEFWWNYARKKGNSKTSWSFPNKTASTPIFLAPSTC